MDKKDGGTIDLESLRGFTPGPHPDAQPTPDECFCDRMYPDSSPSASCGDCPTRDYAPQPPSIPEPSDADIDDARRWRELVETWGGMQCRGDRVEIGISTPRWLVPAGVESFNEAFDRRYELDAAMNGANA